MDETDLKTSPFIYGTHVYGLGSAAWKRDHNATFDEVYDLITAALSEQGNSLSQEHKMDIHEDFIWYSLGEKSSKYPDTRYVNILQIVNLFDYPKIRFILSKKGSNKWYTLIQFKSEQEARSLVDIISNKNNEVILNSEDFSRKNQFVPDQEKGTSLANKVNTLLSQGTNTKKQEKERSTSVSMPEQKEDNHRTKDSKSTTDGNSFKKTQVDAGNETMASNKSKKDKHNKKYASIRSGPDVRTIKTTSTQAESRNVGTKETASNGLKLENRPKVSSSKEGEIKQQKKKSKNRKHASKNFSLVYSYCNYEGESSTTSSASSGYEVIYRVRAR